MKINVLYLDDESDICNVFLETFSTEDVVIETYTDTDSALEAARNKQFDVIFIDYRLPDNMGDIIAQKMPEQIPKYLLSGEVPLSVPKFIFSGVLEKPLNRQLISRVLQDIIIQKDIKNAKSSH